MTAKSCFQRAIDYFGSQPKLGAAIGEPQSNISYWSQRPDRLPADICVKIERATKGDIPRGDLRPDLFGDLQPRGKRRARAS